MVPEEWPIAAPPADRGAEPPRPAGRRCLATVQQDFFLDPRDRLTEQERALMTGMLADLLGCLADEIRAAVPSDWGAANDCDGQQLLRQLGSAGLLGQPELIAILLRRADEDRIGSAVRARFGASSEFLQGLIADREEAVAAAAMALVLARGRRRDRLGQPRVDFDDLPEGIARALVHAVAATVRTSLPAAKREAHRDAQISSAAARVIGRHERARALETVAAALVRALIKAGKLDEGLLNAAADEGDLAFLSEALAHRAGIGGEISWDHLIDGRPGRFALVLRMAGVSRDLAARLLAGLADLLGIRDAGREIERFDSIDDAQVGEAREWLALDSGYRAALLALDVPRG